MTPIDPLFKLQAETLAHDLFDAAERGTVDYKRPKKAREIIDRYKSLHPDWKLTDSDIRNLVNHLRTMSIPIGSNSNGYFYIVDSDSEGARHTKNQLESRLTQMIQAYAGIFPDEVDGLMFRLQIKAKHPGQDILVM